MENPTKKLKSEQTNTIEGIEATSAKNMGKFWIESQFNNLVISVDPDTFDLKMLDRDIPPNPNQVWKMSDKGMLMSLSKHFPLKINDTKVKKGSIVSLSSEPVILDAQAKWELLEDGHLKLSSSEFFLDIWDDDKAKGSRICVWPKREHIWQKWRFLPTAQSVAPSIEPQSPDQITPEKCCVGEPAPPLPKEQQQGASEEYFNTYDTSIYQSLCNGRKFSSTLCRYDLLAAAKKLGLDDDDFEVTEDFREWNFESPLWSDAKILFVEHTLTQVILPYGKYCKNKSNSCAWKTWFELSFNADANFENPTIYDVYKAVATFYQKIDEIYDGYFLTGFGVSQDGTWCAYFEA